MLVSAAHTFHEERVTPEIRALQPHCDGLETITHESVGSRLQNSDLQYENVIPLKNFAMPKKNMLTPQTVSFTPDTWAPQLLSSGVETLSTPITAAELGCCF